MTEEQLKAAYVARHPGSEPRVLVGPSIGGFVAPRPATVVAYIYEVESAEGPEKGMVKRSYMTPGVGDVEAMSNLLKLLEGRSSEGLMGGKPVARIDPWSSRKDTACTSPCSRGEGCEP